MALLHSCRNENFDEIVIPVSNQLLLTSYKGNFCSPRFIAASVVEHARARERMHPHQHCSYTLNH